MGSIVSRIDDIISEYGSWENYLKVNQMEKEYREIVEALNACKVKSGNDAPIIRTWYHQGVKEHSIGTLFKFLYKYRDQCKEVYQKHIDHPYCKPI